MRNQNTIWLNSAKKVEGYTVGCTKARSLRPRRSSRGTIGDHAEMSHVFVEAHRRLHPANHLRRNLTASRDNRNVLQCWPARLYDRHGCANGAPVTAARRAPSTQLTTELPSEPRGSDTLHRDPVLLNVYVDCIDYPDHPDENLDPYAAVFYSSSLHEYQPTMNNAAEREV
ncbi:hypothetical protein EVAR_80453_1 [Eumeta japonica]|uniref:Uncharacterized protein n=1 Tax=Eumeta variegata TaxID=151549 RepID=A0A4C1VIQ1_EUMVA|nr:hypothetical protein EVAR_80453_1 [Eumeta japonica]